MSVNALAVINEAAAAVGDPAFSRVSRDRWRDILNQSARDLARKMNLVTWTATADAVANDEQLALPSDCLQVRSLRYYTNPADESTRVWLEEKYEDEYRALTQRASSSGDPLIYFVEGDIVNVWPVPSQALPAAFRIQHWGLPDEVTNESTQGIPVMDFLRDTLRERMVIHGLRALKEFDTASVHEQEWQSSLTFDRARLEDRSEDRRPRIRTTGSRTSGLFR